MDKFRACFPLTNLTHTRYCCTLCLRSVSLRVKNMLDMAVATMVWWSCGWAVAYGGESESGKFNQFAGPGSFFTRGELFSDATGNYSTEQGYNWALWLFQVLCGSVRACV